MADEDQERFEDYLELERYIEELQAGKSAQPPTDLTPEQARIYQMAALFRSASPENAEPSLAFAEQLKAQLLHAQEDTRSVEPTPEIMPQEISVPSVSSPEPTSTPTKKTGITKPVRFFSRRGLLTGGAVAAASLVIGAGTTHILEQSAASHDKDSISTTQPSSAQLEISTSMPTTWHLATTLAALGQGAVRFTADTLVGYVLRETDTTQGEQIIALSAACTHMGCLVRWQDADRRFHCPCHTAVFAADGTHVRLNYRLSLSPLPRLNTKIENGKVYVQVPQ